MCLLQADNIRVEFDDLVALRGVRFQLQAGDLLGLIGPNGAGKTTLLRALCGLLHPTSGTARICGHDVFHQAHEVRGLVGFAPDEPPAYEELTIEQFLRFIAEAHGMDRGEATEKIEYWLEQVWLTDKRREKIRTLSRGMRQRVTIAQTLLPSPRVVLLDEPSAGLDPAGRIQLRQVIASLARQGKAVIVSSHILADLEEYCTHIAIIERGSILRYSRVADLHHGGTQRIRYQVRLIDRDDAVRRLQSIEGVTNVVQMDGAFVVEYEAGDDSAAHLLRALMETDLRVVSFAPLRQSLEQVYLDAGVRQVD